MVTAAALLAGACGQSAAQPVHHQRQTTIPPDAFITAAAGRTVKMSTGTSCWTAHRGATSVTGCMDAVGWEQYPDLAQIAASKGDQVTVAFGFAPTSRIEVDYGGHSTFIPASSRPTLTVPGRGIFSVDAHGARGDVSYGVRIVPSSG